MKFVTSIINCPRLQKRPINTFFFLLQMRREWVGLKTPVDRQKARKASPCLQQPPAAKKNHCNYLSGRGLGESLARFVKALISRNRLQLWGQEAREWASVSPSPPTAPSAHLACGHLLSGEACWGARGVSSMAMEQGSRRKKAAWKGQGKGCPSRGLEAGCLR